MNRLILLRVTFHSFLVLLAGGGCTPASAQEIQGFGAIPQRVSAAQNLMLENVGFYLDGAVEIDLDQGVVDWKESERDVLKQVTRIVRQVGELQAIDGLIQEVAFSSEVAALIHHVNELTIHDLRHWRMADGLSESEQWYVMVQTAVDELKMQIAIELKYRVNGALFEQLENALREVRELSDAENEWLKVDAEAALPITDWTLSDGSSAALSEEDGSSWFGRGEREHTILGQGNQEVYLASMLERVVQLLEQQDGRLRALESGMPRTVPNESLLPSVLSDTRLMNLRLPEFIDVTFYSGSFKLGLNAQLQLNEVIELMGRYPQLRVVCTGYADLQGERLSNLALSRNRAVAVRSYVLQSGVNAERVLLNYFGEERAQTAGAPDRRVEVRFFVN